MGLQPTDGNEKPRLRPLDSSSRPEPPLRRRGGGGRVFPPPSPPGCVIPTGPAASAAERRDLLSPRTLTPSTTPAKCFSTERRRGGSRVTQEDAPVPPGTEELSPAFQRLLRNSRFVLGGGTNATN